jgi:long-chain acyl-CoA synthetase
MTFSSDYTIPKMIKNSAAEFAELTAQNVRQRDGTFVPVSYRDFFQKGLDFAAALLNLGVKRGQPVGLIADNREEWLDSSLGIMSLGAFDVPRGCDATPGDLEKILSVTECEIVITENNSQVNKIISLKEKLPALKKIISFNNDLKDEVREKLQNANVEYLLFENLMKMGKKWRVDNPDVVENELEKGQGDDIATVIFTSGTTGNPKGVMLTHQNFLAQLDEVIERIYIAQGSICLNVLPVWHVFERECEYVCLIQGGALSYSKPIGSILLADMKTLNPSILPAVPRVFEAVYDGITKKMRKSGKFVNGMFNFFVGAACLQKKMQRKMFAQNPCFTSYKQPLWWILFFIPWLLLWPVYGAGNFLVFRKIKAMLGTKFNAGIAGGGAFPKKIDEFFWAIGVNVVEGYGMTETAPVVAVRPMACPVYRTIGSPLRGIKVRVVDPNDGFILGRCKMGVLQVKGPTVMKGYYKQPELTRKAISEDGWLDTGDLAIITIHDEIQICGRIKDTIVLRGGENLEPVPIETKLQESRYIKTAVVVGQDKRSLGALILVDVEELKTYAEENGIPYETLDQLIASDSVHRLYESEIGGLISSHNGFKLFERINKFCLLTKNFETGVELSAKQEIMRFRINQIYQKEIASLFDDED